MKRCKWDQGLLTSARPSAKSCSFQLEPVPQILSSHAFLFHINGSRDGTTGKQWVEGQLDSLPVSLLISWECYKSPDGLWQEWHHTRGPMLLRPQYNDLGWRQSVPEWQPGCKQKERAVICSPLSSVCRCVITCCVVSSSVWLKQQHQLTQTFVVATYGFNFTNSTAWPRCHEQ